MFITAINRILLDECPFMDGASRRCLLGVETDYPGGARRRRKCRESDHESCIHFMTTMLSKTRGRRVGAISELAEK